MSRWQVIVCLFLSNFIAFAQAQPRDYSISLPRVSYANDGLAAMVSFTVSNQGGDAPEDSQVIIEEYQSGRVEVSENLPALTAGQERAFSVQLSLADLAGNGIISFKVEAGIDEYELAGSPIARNNSQLFHIDMAAAREAIGDSTGASADPPAAPSYDLFVPLVNLGVNFYADGIDLNERFITSQEILVGVGLIVVAFFCLWLLSLILRLIFRRPPTFDTWQPPYAVNTWYDPNSAMGRRQSWQYHAQNSTISAPRVPNQVAVIKRLFDKQGVALGGWQVRALRTVQYDIYGRINRTEVIMPQSINRQLNRVARRADTMDNPQLRKVIAPIAKRLSAYALAAIEKQNLMLPMALDMRFEGEVGEVSVLFELYQYRSDAWHMIDNWEPEMGQIGAHIPEHFTFTLNGQLPGESVREYQARLREDVTQLLAGMFYHHQVEQAKNAESPSDQPADAAPTTDRSLRIGDLLATDDETDQP